MKGRVTCGSKIEPRAPRGFPTFRARRAFPTFRAPRAFHVKAGRCKPAAGVAGAEGMAREPVRAGNCSTEARRRGFRSAAQGRI